VICPVFPRRSAMRGYGTEQRYTKWIALNGGPDTVVGKDHSPPEIDNLAACCDAQSASLVGPLRRIMV